MKRGLASKCVSALLLLNPIGLIGGSAAWADPSSTITSTAVVPIPATNSPGSSVALTPGSSSALSTGQNGLATAAGASGSGASSPGSGNAQQAQQYQSAASDADKAAKTDDTLWKVWAGVAATCTTACLVSMTGVAAAPGKYVCMGAQVAGGATDAAMTKEFQGAMTSVASIGVGAALGKNGGDAAKNGATKATDQAGDKSSQSTDQANQSSGKTDWGSCISAATASAQSVAKHSDMQSQQNTAAQNRAQAAKLNSSAATAQGSGSSNGNSSNGSGALPSASNTGPQGGGATNTLGAPTGPQIASQNTFTTNPIGSSGSSGLGSNNPGANPCQGGSGTFQALYECATASDQTLPAFVNTPQFQAEVKKDLGQSMGELLQSQGSSPQGVISGGLESSGVLNSEGSSIVSAAVGKMEKDSTNGRPGSSSTFANSGRKAPAAGSDTLDFNTMVGDIMQKLIPTKEAAAELPPAWTSMDRAMEARSPASLTDDRAISIFERVTHRYKLLGKQMLPQEKGPLQKTGM